MPRCDRGHVDPQLGRQLVRDRQRRRLAVLGVGGADCDRTGLPSRTTRVDATDLGVAQPGRHRQPVAERPHRTRHALERFAGFGRLDQLPQFVERDRPPFVPRVFLDVEPGHPAEQVFAGSVGLMHPLSSGFAHFSAINRVYVDALFGYVSFAPAEARRVALRQMMSASLPICGILSGPNKPNRHQGKEADPWNLPLRSSTCYSILFLSLRPQPFRPFYRSSLAGFFLIDTAI